MKFWQLLTLSALTANAIFTVIFFTYMFFNPPIHKVVLYEPNQLIIDVEYPCAVLLLVCGAVWIAKEVYGFKRYTKKI